LLAAGAFGSLAVPDAFWLIKALLLGAALLVILSFVPIAGQK
jgi:hypothetical protein